MNKECGWLIGTGVFLITSCTGSAPLLMLGTIIWLISLFYPGYQDDHEVQSSDRYDSHDTHPNNMSLDSTKLVRSQWERDIFDYVRQQTGCSGARTNDRSVIVASDGHTPLEIDIYIPGLRLGIEADGTRWHDRDAYRRDQQNGTEYSEEMYKERYCARRGIKLIHVWDEDGEAVNRRQIDAAIREQRNKLNTW